MTEPSQNWVADAFAGIVTQYCSPLRLESYAAGEFFTDGSCSEDPGASTERQRLSREHFGVGSACCAGVLLGGEGWVESMSVVMMFLGGESDYEGWLFREALTNCVLLHFRGVW